MKSGATRRSRTGDLLITNRPEGLTEKEPEGKGSCNLKNYEECFPAQYGSFWLILVANVVAQINPLDLVGETPCDLLY